MARGATRLDFASHVKVQLRTLKSRLERRNALIEVVRDVNATRDPQKLATWLVRQADDWIHAPCWTVVAPGVGEQLAVMADKGLVPALQPSIWPVAGWVTNQGLEFMSADLAKDRRIRGDGAGSVMAFRPVWRKQTDGVVVGLDATPSSAGPALSACLSSTLRMLLELVGIALEHALALQLADAFSVTDDRTQLSHSI